MLVCSRHAGSNTAKKIVISGSFSTGKTTLFNQMQEYYPTAKTLPEHAWELKSVFPDISWNSQLVRDYLLFSQLVREAQAQSDGTKLLICDTGVLDSVAHSMARGFEPRLELLSHLHHCRYDAVFVCSIAEVPLVDNGIRDIDPGLRTEVHSAVMEIAVDLDYKPIPLVGPLESRLQVLVSWIDSNTELPRCK